MDTHVLAHLQTPLTLNPAVCIKVAFFAFPEHIHRGQGDMIDYPKGSREQLGTKVLGNRLDSGQVVFSFVHSFGGRGSPRS